MSFTTVLGLSPFIISSVCLYILSHKVIYFLIPSLFEISNVVVDYEALGLGPEYQEQQLQEQQRNLGKMSQWVPKLGSGTFSTGKLGRSITSEPLFKEFVHHLFNLNFSLSLLVMELSLCEIENFLPQESRLILWHTVIPVVTVLLTLLIPLTITLLLTDRYLPRWHNNLYYLVSLCVMLCWLYFLSELDVITGISTDKLQHKILSKYVSELTLLGITMIAVLGGVGTISNPFYELIKKPTPVSKYEIDKVVQSIKTTDQILAMREADITRLKAQNGAGGAELKLLQDETSAILQLKSSLNRELVNKSYKLQMQQLGDEKSTTQRLVKLLKKGFAVYCVYRLVSLFLLKLPWLLFDDILSGNAGKGSSEEEEIARDALAVTIAKIITQFKYGDALEEDLLVNQISFLLSGGLFLCSVSSVVNTFHSLLKLVPHSFKSTTSTAQTDRSGRKKAVLRSLMISELLGIYTLLTVLLLRSNLPVALSSNIDSAIGGDPLELTFVENWFDKVSIVTCFSTLIGISIDEFLNQNDFGLDGLDEDGVFFDEEKFIENDKFA